MQTIPENYSMNHRRYSITPVFFTVSVAPDHGRRPALREWNPKNNHKKDYGNFSKKKTLFHCTGCSEASDTLHPRFPWNCMPPPSFIIQIPLLPLTGAGSTRHRGFWGTWKSGVGKSPQQRNIPLSPSAVLPQTRICPANDFGFRKAKTEGKKYPHSCGSGDTGKQWWADHFQNRSAQTASSCC